MRARPAHDGCNLVSNQQPHPSHLVPAIVLDRVPLMARPVNVRPGPVPFAPTRLDLRALPLHLVFPSAREDVPSGDRASLPTPGERQVLHIARNYPLVTKDAPSPGGALSNVRVLFRRNARKGEADEQRLRSRVRSATSDPCSLP